VVHHHGGMGKRGDQRAGIAAPGVQRHRSDRGQPLRRPGASQPSTAALVRSATRSSSRPRCRSTRPVTHLVGATRVALRKLVSSRPSAATPARRWGSSTSGPPWSRTARITVCQPTPRSRATAATGGRPCRPAGTLRPGLARSAPPEDGSRPPARSRYPRRRWARRNADALAPQQHHRPPTSWGRSRTRGRPAAMGFGPHATTRAANKLSRRLDDELPFAGRDLRSEDLEAVQAQQPGGRRTTVLTHLGPPVLQTSDIRKLCKVPGAVLAALHRRQQHTAPRFMTKSQHRVRLVLATTCLVGKPSEGRGKQGFGRLREGKGTLRRFRDCAQNRWPLRGSFGAGPSVAVPSVDER